MSPRRWPQLAAGLLGMLVISNYQYAFGPVFAVPLQQTLGVSKPAILSIFFLFSLAQTLPVPLWGWLSERVGARPIAAMGALLMGGGWLLCSRARTLDELRLAYGLVSGTGVGMFYIVAVTNAVKWFPERRGLAAGVTIFGFGSGASLSIIPLQWLVARGGVPHAFWVAGLVHAVVALAGALALRYPEAPPTPAGDAPSLQESVRGLPFWLLFLSFVLVVSTGLFLTSNLGFIAKWLGLNDSRSWGVPAAALAGTVGAIANSVSRVFWGSLSDRLSRAKTVALSFLLCASFLLVLATPAARLPTAFVLAVAGVFFTWGQVFVLYASYVSDIFGDRHAGAHFGGVYAGKALGSLIGSMGAAWLFAATGSYSPVFALFAAFNVLVPLLTLLVIQPLVVRRPVHELGLQT